MKHLRLSPIIFSSPEPKAGGGGGGAEGFPAGIRQLELLEKKFPTVSPPLQKDIDRCKGMKHLRLSPIIFSSPEPKAHGELIVYQSSRRLSVCLSVCLCVHIFKHEYL